MEIISVTIKARFSFFCSGAALEGRARKKKTAERLENEIYSEIHLTIFYFCMLLPTTTESRQLINNL